jgi:arginase family enzyme
VIDPAERWRRRGVAEKPDYAGLLTFAGALYAHDAAALEGADVAVIGAPFDDLVSDRPGTRLGPRAIRTAGFAPGPHLEAKVDAFADLRIADFGDAACVPGDAAGSHAAIEDTVGEALDAGAVPIVLGGDH